MRGIITLKYPATCADCGASLPAGSRARWYGRGRVYGVDCHSGTATPKDSGLTLRHFALAAFPAYKGRKIRLHVATGGMSLSSYWSGGSRDYHVVVRLSDMRQVSVPENGSGFTQIDKAYGPAGIPVSLPAPGYAVVTHSMFCGKDVGLTVNLHPENVAALAACDRPILPAPPAPTVPTNEDYPCSDRGYEDACAQRVGL